MVCVCLQSPWSCCILGAVEICCWCTTVTSSSRSKLVINLTGYQFKLSVVFFGRSYNTERNFCHFWRVQQRWKELLLSRKWRWVNSCKMVLASMWGRRLRMHVDKQRSWIKILLPKWGRRTRSGLGPCPCPLCLKYLWCFFDPFCKLIQLG